MEFQLSPCQQIWKTRQWPQDWKRSLFIPIPKKSNAKECSNYHTIALISHTRKVMLKFSKPGFNSMWIVNFHVQAGFRKGRGTRDQTAKSVGSSKKQESSRKTSTSALLTMLKPLSVWITINCGKFWERWEYQTTWPASWEICIQVKKQQLEPYMEKWAGCKLGKEYIKAIYCHPASLTYTQSTSRKLPGWVKHKLESRLPGEISISTDMQVTPPLCQKVNRN